MYRSEEIRNVFKKSFDSLDKRMSDQHATDKDKLAGLNFLRDQCAFDTLLVIAYSLEKIADSLKKPKKKSTKRGQNV